MFKEIKISDSDLQSIQIFGFGTGRSANPKMAALKAQTNAMANLVDQINGREFSYQRSEKDIKFTSSLKGMLSKTEVVTSYGLSDNTILAILSSPLPVAKLDLQNAFLLETEFRTGNLEKALIEKYQTAVEELISRKFKNKSGLAGKIYLSDIKLSDFEGKSDFAVSMKLLIVVSANENYRFYENTDIQ